MTREYAIAMAETGWWKEMPLEEAARFQLFEEKLWRFPQRPDRIAGTRRKGLEERDSLTATAQLRGTTEPGRLHLEVAMTKKRTTPVPAPSTPGAAAPVVQAELGSGVRGLAPIPPPPALQRALPHG